MKKVHECECHEAEGTQLCHLNNASHEVEVHELGDELDGMLIRVSGPCGSVLGRVHARSSGHYGIHSVTRSGFATCVLRRALLCGKTTTNIRVNSAVNHYLLHRPLSRSLLCRRLTRMWRAFQALVHKLTNTDAIQAVRRSIKLEEHTEVLPHIFLLPKHLIKSSLFAPAGGK